MDLRGRVVATACLLVMPLSGCGEEGADADGARDHADAVDPSWYDALDQAVADADQVGGVPIMSRDKCPISAPEIAGEELEGSPYTGVSTLGDSGHRLVCQWPSPSTDVVVARFEDEAELRRARDEVSAVGEVDNGDNVRTTEAITVEGRQIFVRRTVYPTNDTHIDYSAWYLDDQNRGIVLLDVEATDTRDLKETYDAQQAAEDLARFLS